MRPDCGDARHAGHLTHRSQRSPSSLAEKLLHPPRPRPPVRPRTGPAGTARRAAAASPTTPVVMPRIRSTERYSGVTSTTQRSTDGYASAGTNVPENRNSANCADAIRSKSCQLRMNVDSAMPDPAEGEADQHRRQEGDHGRAGRGQPHHHHDHQERRGVEAAPDHRPGQLAERDLHRPYRGGQDPVVQLHELHLPEEVEGGLGQRTGHRRRRQHGRRHERGVADHPPSGSVRSPTRRAHADADGEQVEHRLEEAGRPSPPSTPSAGWRRCARPSTPTGGRRPRTTPAAAGPA